MIIKSCSWPTHRPPVWKHTQVLVHNQYVGVSQNSLKHYLTPHINLDNRMASTLLRPPSPLQILIPPSAFTWPTIPASLRAEPSQRSSSVLSQSNLPRFPFLLNPPFHHESLIFHLNCLSPHFKFYQPFFPTLIRTSLYGSENINAASSFPRDRHANSFLHC